MTSTPIAWINKNGNTMSNEEYLEHKASKGWFWIINKYWKNAIPLFQQKDLAYIQKLERRIHNQRVALRENWMIVEMRRSEYCGTLRPLRSKWWNYIKNRKQNSIPISKVEELIKKYKDREITDRCPVFNDLVELIDKAKQ